MKTFREFLHEQEYINEAIPYKLSHFTTSFSDRIKTKNRLISKSLEQKYLKALENKIKTYLKTEYKYNSANDIERNKKVDDSLKEIMKIVKHDIDTYGSLPSLGSTNFINDAGDIMRDIFPSYSFSFDFMSKLEKASLMVALSQKIIKPTLYDDIEKIVNDVLNKYDVEIKQVNQFIDYLVNEILYNIGGVEDSTNSNCRQLYSSFFKTYIKELEGSGKNNHDIFDDIISGVHKYLGIK